MIDPTKSVMALDLKNDQSKQPHLTLLHLTPQPPLPFAASSHPWPATPVSSFVSEMHPWPGSEHEPGGFFVVKSGDNSHVPMLLELKENCCKTRMAIPWLESMKLSRIPMSHTISEIPGCSSLQTFEPYY